MTINTRKLSALRDEHASLGDRYKSLSERARDAAAEVARLQLVPTSGNPQQRALMARLLALPLADLEAQDPEQLRKLGIDPRLIRDVIDAQARAAKLRSDAAELTPRLHRSATLIDKLNRYAVTQNL